MEEVRIQKDKENQNQDRNDEETNLLPKFQPFCKFCISQFYSHCNVEYILSSLEKHLKRGTQFATMFTSLEKCNLLNSYIS